MGKSGMGKYSSLKSVKEDDLDSFGEQVLKETRTTDNDLSDRHSA